MDIGQYVTQVQEALATVADASDEETRNAARLFGAAIEPAARLALLNALSDFAAEVTAALDDRVVEVRLDGRDVRVAVSPGTTPAPEPQPGPGTGPGSEPQPGPQQPFRGFGGFGGDAGDISRITLRLVEQIKSQAEQAASEQGVSLNSWVAQAVQGALSGRRPGHRGGPPPTGNDARWIRGWAQG